MPESEYDFQIVAGITAEVPDEQQIVVVGVKPPLKGLVHDGAAALEDVTDVFTHNEGTDIMFESDKPSRIHSRRVVERYLQEEGYSVGILSTIVHIDYDNSDSIFTQMEAQVAQK